MRGVNLFSNHSDIWHQTEHDKNTSWEIKQKAWMNIMKKKYKNRNILGISDF